MAPAIEPGDWLLVDPTSVRWPRRGSVVVFREPDGGGLAVKRVAAGPGDRVAFAQGYLELAEDEAWLLSDATAETDGRARLRRAGRFAVVRPGPPRAPGRAGVVPLRAAPSPRPDRPTQLSATATQEARCRIARSERPVPGRGAYPRTPPWSRR